MLKKLTISNSDKLHSGTITELSFFFSFAEQNPKMSQEVLDRDNHKKKTFGYLTFANLLTFN